jgi:hypothetical protein
MGKLLIMPSGRSNADQQTPLAGAIDQAAATQNQSTETEFAPAGTGINLWLSAPREGQPSYAATYSAVSLAMQSALRRWVGDWVRDHPEAMERRVSGYSLLAFACTRPFRGRSTNLFTYDVQQTSAVDRALNAAGRMIADKVKQLEILRQTSDHSTGPRLIPSQVAQMVRQKRTHIYRMFTVETLLMDEILKFTQINIPKLGLEKAAAELHSAFERHLRRFTSEFDLSELAGELIALATEALRAYLFEDTQMPVAA